MLTFIAQLSFLFGLLAWGMIRGDLAEFLAISFLILIFISVVRIIFAIMDRFPKLPASIFCFISFLGFSFASVFIHEDVTENVFVFFNATLTNIMKWICSTSIEETIGFCIGLLMIAGIGTLVI